MIPILTGSNLLQVAQMTASTITKTPRKIRKRVVSTVKNDAAQLDALLKIAESVNSTKEELTKAWKSTKSTKIRKKIASNGNADTDILKMSARLYLKEVLQNPSFELTELFVDDPFVKALSSAHKDPKLFISKGGQYQFKSADCQILLRACLLSPHLDYKSLIGNIIDYLPAETFKRELQDRDVFNRVKSLVGSQFDFSNVKSKKWTIKELSRIGSSNNHNLNHFFTLYKSGVVQKESLFNLLYKAGINSNRNFGGNSTAVNFILENLKSNETENATKLLLCGNYSTLNAIEKKAMNSETNEYLYPLVKCFDVIIDMISAEGWDKRQGSREFHVARSLFETITDLIIHSCINTTKKKDMVDLSREDFISIYNTYNESGFKEYANIFMQNRMNIEDPKSLYSLNKCPQEVIEFFVYNNFLKPRITVSTSVNNIVDSLEKINNIGGVEEMVYNHLNLDYFKRIKYDEDIMRIKSIVYFGSDLRKFPACVTNFGWDDSVPAKISIFTSKYKDPSAYTRQNPIGEKILNMT